MLGGYISDKYLGNRNCIIMGGTLMGIGQLLLFFSGNLYASNLSLATNVMWVALLTIIFGNGFFKPNISSMVGSLYPREQKNKLDSAFTIFYLGINVGATLGQFICPFFGDVERDGIRDLSAFKWGFLAAALAMFTGVITFLILKNRYVRTPEGVPIGGKPKKSDIPADESDSAKFTSTNIIISFALLVAITYGLHLVFQGPGDTWIKGWLYPFIFAAGISLGYLILSDKTITKIEKDRIWVLYVVCFFVMFFWGAFEQAGSSLTFIADNQTDNHILGWEMPAAMVQNFNGIFVMLFAIPFSYLWIWMNKRKLEPISPVKQAWGLMLIALGYFIIATQVKGLGTTGKVGVIWMVVLYLLHTWGELCLSPIGLSLVAKLAPKRFASLLMGVWFLGNAGGYVLTGILGALLPPTGEAYINMSKENIQLENLLEGKKAATGTELYTLAKNKIGTTIYYQKGLEHNLDFVKILKAKDSVLTPQQLDLIEKEKLITVSYPKFAGFTLRNVYDFFMMFVVLCGLAGLLLYALSPILKRMMHGIR
jgi:POT family proton-dependent oligopeptide transporter